MTLPVTVNVEMMSGDTRSLLVNVKDSDGTPLDLTDKTLTYAMAVSPGADAAVSKTVGDGITVTDAPNGVLTVDLAPSDTASLQGAMYHELELQDGANRFTLFRGRINLVQDLIR